MRLSTLSRIPIPTMKLGKFLKLKQAISRLDLIAKRILKLDEHLQKHGLALEPENTAMTEEGIFYKESASRGGEAPLASSGFVNSQWQKLWQEIF